MVRPRLVRVALLAPLLAALLVVLVEQAAVAPASGGPEEEAAPGPAADPVPPVPATSGRPSFVVIVMDDVSLDLLRTMPRAVQMQREGATYRNALVVDSMCCPSRAATFTGRPPHLNGVRTNTGGGPGGPLGGYDAWVAHDGPEASVNVSLQARGYTTGFVGKYLNEYEPGVDTDGNRLPPELVPGWDDFEAISGEAYSGWGYYRTSIAAPGQLDLTAYPTPSRSAPRRERDRANVAATTDSRVLGTLRRYEAEKRAGGAPYYLHVAPYAAHSRLAPAWPGEPVFPAQFRDRPSRRHPDGNCGAVACADLTVDDLTGYGDGPDDNVPVRAAGSGTSPAPSWRTDPFTLDRSRAETFLRDRARMVQSVDRLLARVLDTVGSDTYVVLTSDNGMHLGQHALDTGKGTPYDSDTRVPLVVSGPGVVPGEREQWVSNIDLAPTLEDLSGRPPRPLRAGTSFAGSLSDPAAAGSRFVFLEHTHGPAYPGEPDAPIGSGARLDALPSYVAVRGDQGLLVRLDLDDTDDGVDHAWELYTYRTHTWEHANEAAELWGEPWVDDLAARIEAWSTCRPAQCRALVR